MIGALPSRTSSNASPIAWAPVAQAVVNVRAGATHAESRLHAVPGQVMWERDVEMDRHAAHAAFLVRLPGVQEIVVHAGAAGADDRAGRLKRGRRFVGFAVDQTSSRSAPRRRPRRPVAQSVRYYGVSSLREIDSESLSSSTSPRIGAVDDRGIEILGGADAGLSCQQPIPELAGTGPKRRDRAETGDDDASLRSGLRSFVLSSSLSPLRVQGQSTMGRVSALRMNLTV